MKKGAPTDAIKLPTQDMRSAIQKRLEDREKIVNHPWSQKQFEGYPTVLEEGSMQSLRNLVPKLKVVSAGPTRIQVSAPVEGGWAEEKWEPIVDHHSYLPTYNNNIWMYAGFAAETAREAISSRLQKEHIQKRQQQEKTSDQAQGESNKRMKFAKIRGDYLPSAGIPTMKAHPDEWDDGPFGDGVDPDEHSRKRVCRIEALVNGPVRLMISY